MDKNSIVEEVRVGTVSSTSIWDLGDRMECYLVIENLSRYLNFFAQTVLFMYVMNFFNDCLFL